VGAAVLFLIFIVVAWDLTIRVFRIPAYQIPAPGDVVAVLWTDWPELLRQAWPTTYATSAASCSRRCSAFPSPC